MTEQERKDLHEEKAVTTSTEVKGKYTPLITVNGVPLMDWLRGKKEIEDSGE